MSTIASQVHPFTYSFTTCFKEKEIVDMLKLSPPSGDVLEMGCGSAYFSTVLRRDFEHAEFAYTGIDLEKDAVKVAKPFLGPSDRIVNGSVTEMPFEGSSFDLVLYLDVIEHVDDDKKSVEEAYRVLKPGGILIISTPNSSAPLTDTFLCEYMHDHGHMDNHRPGYSEEELGKLLSNAGFKIEKVSYTNVLLSEFLITLTKLGYRLKNNKYNSQADVINVSNSLLFKIHKAVVFPVGYAIGRLEELVLGRIMKGHCLIMKCRK